MARGLLSLLAVRLRVTIRDAGTVENKADTLLMEVRRKEKKEVLGYWVERQAEVQFKAIRPRQGSRHLGPTARAC